MSKMIELKRELPVTTSLVVAKGIGRTHKSVIQLVRKYEKDLKTFGTLAFEMRKSAGRPLEFVYLNEAQVYFLLTLMRNNKIITEFKKQLITEFVRMKKTLINLQVTRKSNEWKENRVDGKKIRKETTDVIQEFVKYATKQGSNNAIRYYSNITRMENRALFILEQKFPNVREVLNNRQLSTIKTADNIVVEALQEGMERELNYKDIYKLAKDRVERLAELIKPTLVMNFDEVKLIENKGE